jgi:uncharacterized protein (TIGR04255 family)
METHVQAPVQAGKLPEMRAKPPEFFGLFMRDEAESKAAQFRTDGLTLSQLRDYTTAEPLFAEAFEMWEAFAGIVRPTAVVRVALRYINRLRLPFRPGDEFDRFLTSAPTMPADAPQDVSEFFTRVVVVTGQEYEVTGIITQQLERPTEGTPGPFILDIDVFKAGEFQPDRGTLEPILRDLRQVKNQLFFAFLTDEALEPYR